MHFATQFTFDGGGVGIELLVAVVDNSVIRDTEMPRDGRERKAFTDRINGGHCDS